MLQLKAIKIPEEPYSYKLATWGHIWWVNPHPNPILKMSGTWLINFLTSDKYNRHIFNMKVGLNADFKPRLLFKLGRRLIFLTKG